MAAWLAWALASMLLASSARAQTDADEDATGAFDADDARPEAVETGAPDEEDAPLRGAEAAGPDEQGAPPGEAQTAPPAPPWRWPGTLVWDIQVRIALPPQTDFDRALLAHGHADADVVPTLVTGIAVPVGVEWLWLGGQLGLRGRTWDHVTREDASMVAVDLLAMVRARFLLGERVELGVGIGGGLGWMGVWVNGVMTDQFAPRFDVHAELAFRIGRYFAIGPRVGWDYFQWSGVNQYGHSVDAGGPFLGISLEGRE